MIISKLPMTEEKIVKIAKETKTEAIKMFHSLTLGDIKNSKNSFYMEKMKNEFKERKEFAFKRNKDTIQVNCVKVLDQIFNMSIKQKQIQG